MSRIKLCGLTRPEDIRIVNEEKPDYIGFVFAPSRRQVTAGQAAGLKEGLSSSIQAVGVFVNSPMEEILSIAQEGIIDLIQLHGDESSDYIEALQKQLSARPGGGRLPIIRSVRVRSEKEILAAGQSPANYLLLDTYVKDQYGGSGQVFDWSLIPPLTKPYFLAGGLNAGNLNRAMSTGAYCLDLSSAVETDGKKDPEKIKEIMNIIRSVPSCQKENLVSTEGNSSPKR